MNNTHHTLPNIAPNEQYPSYALLISLFSLKKIKCKGEQIHFNTELKFYFIKLKTVYRQNQLS